MSAGSRPTPNKPYQTLRRRADFLAANRGRRAPMPGFVLLLRERGDGDPAIRLGLTVSRKVGGAVVRNRMKRRFRELARELLPESGLTGADLVLIGRPGGIERDYGLLRDELHRALKKVQANTVRAELVEALPASPEFEKGEGRPSTGSGRAGGGGEGE